MNDIEKMMIVIAAVLILTGIINTFYNADYSGTGTNRHDYALTDSVTAYKGSPDGLQSEYGAFCEIIEKEYEYSSEYDRGYIIKTEILDNDGGGRIPLKVTYSLGEDMYSEYGGYRPHSDSFKIIRGTYENGELTAQVKVSDSTERRGGTVQADVSVKVLDGLVWRDTDVIIGDEGQLNWDNSVTIALEKLQLNKVYKVEVTIDGKITAAEFTVIE